MSLARRVGRWARQGVRWSRAPVGQALGRLPSDQGQQVAQQLERAARLALRTSRFVRSHAATASVDAGPARDLTEENRRFGERVRAEWRAEHGLPEGGETFADQAVEFFAKGISSPLYARYVQYALRSLDRGQRLVDQFALSEGSVESYLDVGCAYGGPPIQMARHGAKRVLGLEYDGRLLELAQRLAQEQGVADRVRFEEGDLTDVEAMSAHGRFELVTCIDVLEHVLDPSAAIESLRRLVADGGSVIVDVPNPDSFAQIEHDPHHRLFGSVRLPRDEAIRVFEHVFPGNKRYTVGYFHTLEWYLDRLDEVGFDVELLDRVATDSAAVQRTVARLEGLLDELFRRQHLEGWPEWRSRLVRARLDPLLAQARADRALLEADPEAFQRRYAVPVHHLRCRPRAP